MTTEIDPDAPIRLKDVIPIMFPLGGMTPSGLRKEAVRGRLALTRIAGRLHDDQCCEGNAALVYCPAGGFGGGGGSGGGVERGRACVPPDD